MLRPPFAQFPEIQLQGYVLRQLTDDDLPDILPIIFYDGKPALTPAKAKNIVARIENDYQSGNTINWGIAEKTTNKIVGTCGFYRGFANNTGEIGYVMHPGFRGSGIMQQAVAAISGFGTAQLGLEKVVAFTKPDNAASIAILQKCGFTEEPSEEKAYLKFVFRKL